MNAELSSRRVFHALDAGRGVAAIAVVIFHMPGTIIGTTFQSGYLAVDFFFAISGFVLAHAYLDRMSNGHMNVREFMVARIVRLYPLYLISLLTLMVVLVCMTALALPLPWSRFALLGKLPPAFLMLPSPSLDWHGYIYPFNIAAWSIFFELLVNFLFALVCVQLQKKLVRWAFIVISGVLLAVQLIIQDELGGASWNNLLAGVPRVCFSFFVGVQIHEWLSERGARPPVHSVWFFAALAVLVIILCMPGHLIVKLVAIFILFPILMMVLALSDVSKGAIGDSLRRLGLLSYAIYMMHSPILFVLTTAYQHLGLSIAPDFIAVSMLGVVIAVSWIANRWLDGPIRNWAYAILRRHEAKRNLATRTSAS